MTVLAIVPNQKILRQLERIVELVPLDGDGSAPAGVAAGAGLSQGTMP